MEHSTTPLQLSTLHYSDLFTRFQILLPNKGYQLIKLSYSDIHNRQDIWHRIYKNISIVSNLQSETKIFLRLAVYLFEAP